MAFDFIKKVFSFGARPLERSPDPAAEERDEPAARDAPISPRHAFPGDMPAGSAARGFAPSETAEPPGVPPEIPTSPLGPASQPVPLEVPPAPAPSAPIVPPEIPQAPIEVPSAPDRPGMPDALPEIPAAPVEPLPPAPPAEVPREPAPPQPSLPEVPDEPPAPAEVPLGPSGPEGARAEAAVDVFPLEPEMPALPSASPPVALSPSTARQKFGDRVFVGKAVGQQAEATAAVAAAPQNWLARMRSGLSRSSRELSGNLSGVFTKGQLTEDFVDELEEVLIRSDFGADTAMRITDALTEGRYGFQTTEREIRDVMAGEIAKVLAPVAKPLELDLGRRPHVILVVGVNGTGKTTTIGKLAAKLTAGGLSVMLAAGDTFRAAAIEQLKIWGERTNSPVVSSRLGADAAGLAFEAFERARDAGADVLIIDTAGRLQNKAELMAELEKIVRVLRKLDANAPHTVLQTLDATTGQNALNQVDIFRSTAGVNGLVMTKLDGTARGGILVAIAAKHKLPVFFIGVGEGVEDLEPFSAREFAETIAGTTYG